MNGTTVTSRPWLAGRVSIPHAAQLALLMLCFACGTRAQEPARPAAAAESRTSSADVRREPPAAPKGRPRQDVSLDATAIRGNQELPKVLYIVPWKEPVSVELTGRPVNSLVEEVLAPVDREVFRRQARYFDQLYSGRPGPGGPPVRSDK